MGYSHYWDPAGPIDPKAFNKIFHDFRTLYFAEKMRIKEVIHGPHGDSLPLITDKIISFNGNRNCNHESNKEVLFFVPGKEHKVSPATLYGTHIETSPVRACSRGKCSCETMTLFSYENKGLLDIWKTNKEDFFLGSIKTNFKPYDLAVQCLLIIARRYIRNFSVSSDGSEEFWFDAQLVCQMNLGYGLNFHLA